MRRTAHRAAAWRRRRPGSRTGAFDFSILDGPQDGATPPFPENPLDVSVQIVIDGSFQDITHDVFGEGRADIVITRGTRNEGGRTDAGRCTLQLNNRDGRYSPRNPMSPLYGKIGRNTELQVKIGADVRFRGEVTAWPVSWDKTGTDVWVDLEAAGIMRRLDVIGQKPARSALVRRVADVSDDQFILVHWPFEDSSDATFIAAVTDGAGPIAVATGLRFAADDFLPGSLPVAEVPENTPVHYHGVVPVDPNPSPTGYEVDFFIHMPEAPAGATRIKVVGSSGTVARWEISVSSTQLVLTGVTSLGVGVVLDSSTPDAFFFAEAGCRYRLRVRDIGGGTVSWALDVHNVGFTTFAAVAGTYAGSAGRATYVANAVESTVTYGIGHVIVSSADGFTNSLSPADIGYLGDEVDERARRLCAEEGVGFRLIGTRGDSHTMGPQPAEPFLDLLREGETVDGGIFGESVDALSLFYRTRSSLYTQQPTLILDYASGALWEVPIPVPDDEHVVNDVTLSRPNGSQSRHVVTAGPLSTQDPPDGVGVYATAQALNVERDDQLEQRAAWWASLGTVDEARFPVIEINLAHQSITSDPDLPSQAAQVRQGDRIRIVNPPAWLPPEPIDQLVIGITETLSNFGRRLRFNCISASPYEIGVVDNDNYKIDNDGSTIAVTAAAGATSLTVAAPNGLWTTDSGEMPFDIIVLGERITVTAIAGASSPQTFTVTRAVNGVAKELSAGAEVHVFSPFRAGL